STAFTLGFFMDPATTHAAVWDGASVIGCGILTNGTVVDGVRDETRASCAGLVERWRHHIATFDPDLVLVATGVWEMRDQIIDGRVAAPGSPSYDATLQAALDQAIRVFTSRGADVVLLDVPCFGPSENGNDRVRTDARRRAAIDDAFEALARHNPQVSILRWSAFLCPHGDYEASIDGTVVRPDGVHFDAAGGTIAWKWLGPRVLADARRAQGRHLENGGATTSRPLR